MPDDRENETNHGEQRRTREDEACAKEAVGTVVGVAAAMAGTLLASGAPPLESALIAGATSLLPTVSGRIGGWVAMRRLRRLKLWFDTYLHDDGVDPEQLEAELQLKGGQPETQEVVIEGVRAVDDVLADEVVPALARLTRHYVSSGLQADGFFRGARRLLSDLTNEEFRALRLLTQRVLALDLSEHIDELRLEHANLARNGPPQGVKCQWLERDTAGKTSWSLPQQLGAIPHALRLFHLLKANDLGSDSVTGSFAPHAGPNIIHLRLETLARLRPLIG